MRRVYFLIPNQESARAVVTDLRAADIEERDIAVLAKQEKPLETLPQATELQKSDFVPALQRGVGIGGAMGLFAGLAALAFPPAGIVVGGGAVLTTTAAGAALGAWASSLIGVSVPNTQLEKFETAIERGEILMLVDIEEERIEDIQTLVRRYHPEVEFQGVEPQIKVMP